MAKPPRFTAQCPPWKATPTQRARIDAEALERQLDIADLMREMTDQRYGLVDGEPPADAGADAG